MHAIDEMKKYMPLRLRNMKVSLYTNTQSWKKKFAILEDDTPVCIVSIFSM